MVRAISVDVENERRRRKERREKREENLADSTHSRTPSNSAAISPSLEEHFEVVEGEIALSSD